MRFSIGFLLVAILVGCGADVGEPSSPAAERNSAPAPLEVEAEAGEFPHIARKPDLQPGNILSEKMNWSRVNMAVKVNVTIEQTGAVMATSLASVSPPDSELASEVGQFVTERFKTAVFEAPSEFSYPHSFEVTVNLSAPRDADGRLK